METEHDLLVKNAIEAIRSIHSDTSVSLETVLESLETLYDEIYDLVSAVKWDIKNKDDELVS